VTGGPGDVAALVAAIEPYDDTERAQQADVLAAGMPLVLDPREFAGGCWWTGPELDAADPARFDPNMGRFLAKVRGAGFREAGLRGQPRA
jgi:hypothetical protein